MLKNEQLPSAKYFSGNLTCLVDYLHQKMNAEHRINYKEESGNAMPI